MLLAIDVGNSNTVCGIWDGSGWLATWRRKTSPTDIGSRLGEWLAQELADRSVSDQIDALVGCSVVANLDEEWLEAGQEFLNLPTRFLKTGAEVGLAVDYDPPGSVGSDRIANALGALDLFEPPFIVIDFGTATTFDVVDASGTFVGGAIMPGLGIASESLFARAPRLPRIELKAPSCAIGRTTIASLESGIVLAYAGGIDSLAGAMVAELGGRARIVATGGLGGTMAEVCHSIESYRPTLTLDGLVIAHMHFAQADSR